MTKQDIRWIQGFNNFSKALSQLKEVVDMAQQRVLSNLEKLGAIHIFELTHELACKVLRDFLKNQGTANLFGARDTTRAAFKVGFIKNDEAWMQMIENRQLIESNYDANAISKVTSIVISNYFSEFKKLQKTFTTFKNSHELTP